MNQQVLRTEAYLTGRSKALVDFFGARLSVAILLFAGVYTLHSSPSDTVVFPTMQIRYSGNQTVSISFPAAKQTTYTILYSDSLFPANWRPLKQINQNANDTVINEADTVISGKQRYYRLQQAQAVSPSLLSATPSANATNILASTTVELRFSGPVLLSSTTNPIALSDDLGRQVQGVFAWTSNNAVLSFYPAMPLAHDTLYTIQTSGLGSAAQLATNQWAFQTAPSKPLVEDRTVYLRDTLDVAEIRIRTMPVPGGFTFEDVNNDADTQDNIEPRVDVIFEEGVFGADLSTANGYLELRGQTTRQTAQKSFKVTLNKKSGLWRGLRTINLNKHPYDLSRVRNKLCFDLFEGIPHMTSLRTQFVHVYIDGKDYGLFTQIENPDTLFLESHGLDAGGNLYKATYFEFFRYPESLRSKSDPQYNKAEFEKLLEIKGSDNHDKLIAMLDDLNNPDIDINRVIAKYFNRDNYLTWFACNILMGNLDTSSQNFFLYSPKNSSAWYFMPWDYDGSLGYYDQPDLKNFSLARWQQGLANWWGAVLHRRFVQDSRNMADLTKRINELFQNHLRSEALASLLSNYRPMIESYVSKEPDSIYLPIEDWQNPIAEFTQVYSYVGQIIPINLQVFTNTLGRPMPVYLWHEPIDAGWWFSWDASYQYQGHSLLYEFELSKTTAFNAQDIIYRKSLHDTELTITTLPSGSYFWRVVIHDEINPTVDWQLPFESYWDEKADRVYHGMKPIEVP